jgi:hypothetical protein
MGGEISDLVDEHFRPFVRALGNLVITFALAESALLDMVAEMLDQDKLTAAAILNTRYAKENALILANSLGLIGYDLDQLLKYIESFWADKEKRNRLIHDQRLPDLLEAGCGAVMIRGLTRGKTPKEIFGTQEVEEIWRLAHRFREYEGLFSHRAYMIRREREGAVD